MYASRLSIYNFKSFGNTSLAFQYPGREGEGTSEISNINLIVGDNGGGKSSVLRALAIAAVFPALFASGFVPYRLVRRPNAKSALLKIDALLDATELSYNKRKNPQVELLARLNAPPHGGNEDRLDLKGTPFSPLRLAWDDERSPSFFVMGFGATRRIEISDYSESSARKSRNLRYQRIASLFEDHVAIRPISSWMLNLSAVEKRMAVRAINSVLPESIRFTGRTDKHDGQYLFEFDGLETPLSSLSDGYKSFIGWTGELVSQLIIVSNGSQPLEDIPGVVLVDEIDLHLHPSWQRQVVPMLSAAFPKIQFILTTHSPLVTSTVRKENIFVTDKAEDGTAIVKQLGESAYGASVEQLLLSSYFGLTSLQPQGIAAAARELFERAARGDTKAAIQYLETITQSSVSNIEPDIESTPTQKKSITPHKTPKKKLRKKPLPKKKKR